MPLREISIANRHPRLRINRHAIIRAIRVLDAEFTQATKPLADKFPVPAGELSLVFVTDPSLAQLHADFLDDPSVTDVITFEGDPSLGTAGEICVSADAAARHVGTASSKNASARNRTAKMRTSFSAELTLYLVHGWLHLAGYDDLQPAKKRLMRRAEARAMRLLRSRDCMPEFQLR